MEMCQLPSIFAWPKANEATTGMQAGCKVGAWGCVGGGAEHKSHLGKPIDLFRPQGSESALNAHPEDDDGQLANGKWSSRTQIELNKRSLSCIPLSRPLYLCKYVCRKA